MVLFLSTACHHDGDSSDPRGRSGKPQILTTTGMLADLARNVAGTDLQVTALMGSGVDPHLYKASAGDVSRLARADLILYNGLHLEARMADVLGDERLREKSVPVGERLNRERLLAADSNGKTFDPHFWFDVTLWMDAARVVRDEMSRRFPQHASMFEANTARYLAQLETLDREVRGRIGAIPEPQRVLITAHDAFRYFGRAYGIEVRDIDERRLDAKPKQLLPQELIGPPIQSIAGHDPIAGARESQDRGCQCRHAGTAYDCPACRL
jgi:manganese/zinc/iron transport system substrate-binding protein